MAAPSDLRCEYHENPVGIGEVSPRLAWIVNDPRRGAAQTAYQVLVASSSQRLAHDKGDLWDSGRVASDQSTQVAYEGRALRSRQPCWWKVRVWDVHHKPSPWSAAAWWEMGLLQLSDWSARWIGSTLVGSPDTGAPAPLLRCGFHLDGKPVRARLYATALGLYECRINGRCVGHDVLTPGWTDYARRVPVQTYDITDALEMGKNAIGAMLGDGWYCGHVNHFGRQVWGDRPRFMAQIEVEFADGRTQRVVTDDTWRTAQGPIIANDLFMGEVYDARHEQPGWDGPEFDDGAWSPVRVFSIEPIKMDPSPGPRVRRMVSLCSTSVRSPGHSVFVHSRAGYIFDLGQNICGRVRLKVRARPGQVFTLRHAETLNPDGTLYVQNLRSARATDSYTARGEGEEIYEPRFTFHGFRYVEVHGFAEPPPLDAVTGIVLHSDMELTGGFECSDPLLNRLHANIQWSQRGNFLEVPTDCPQRDERMGWTGDAQLYARTAAFNMDVAAFFTKWQRDLVDAQGEQGSFPMYAPRPREHGEDGGPGFADAGIICPWTIYLCFGDHRILERHYPSMTAFMDFLERTSPQRIRGGEDSTAFAGFGDWLAIDAVEPGRAPTPKPLIGTAYYAHIAGIMSRIAAVLGRENDRRRYARLQTQIVKAFNHHFVTPAGRILGNTQTAYAMALAFDLLPEEQREQAVRHLVRLIEERGGHLSTGFLGTPLLCPVLSRFGRTDVAFQLLMRKTYPSWLYPVTLGATTMWERWNSWTPERGFADAGMNSFNHYAYGAIGQWLYAAVAGIDLDPGCPGYKHVIIHPQPGGGLTWAKGQLQSPYGIIATHWTLTNGRFTLELTVPPNTTATVHLPGGAATESGRKLACGRGIAQVRTTDAGTVCEIGSGDYKFSTKLTA